MGHPFEHPAIGKLLKRVARSYREAPTYVVRNANILFVCGGNIKDTNNMRPQFIAFAHDQLSNFRVFLAEDAQKDYFSHPDSVFVNVAQFEENISDVSDCVILFPESPGSHAELGYFAQSKEIRKKLLVVNDAGLQGQDSFISLGPLEIIDRHSRFKPTIHVAGPVGDSFTIVKKRLELRLPTERRRRITANKYGDLTFKEKLYFVFEIIRLFQVASYDGIRHAFKHIWGNAKREELYRILSILVAVDYIRRHSTEVDLFYINRDIAPLMEANSFNETLFRLEIAGAYRRYFPDVSAILDGIGK